jgi:branched-subunit amino acid ABC-type transport system permease component
MRTKAGAAMRCIEDKLTASLMGIDIDRSIVVIYMGSGRRGGFFYAPVWPVQFSWAL